MWHIKNLEVLNPHHALKEICYEVMNRFGICVITSAYRPGDDGVHGTTPLRGMDFRCKDAVIGHHVADYINMRWVYDEKRPEKVCAMYHGGEGNWHLHFQSHPNTEKVYRDKW